MAVAVRTADCKEDGGAAESEGMRREAPVRWIDDKSDWCEISDGGKNLFF